MTFANSRVRLLVATLCALCLLLGASVASAVGRVEWKSKTVKERTTKSWRLELKIYLPRAPDVAHVPMKFEFEPIAYYERAMVDGDKLIERTVPLENRQSMIESVDVGFMDPASGKIQTRTKFSFKVTRAHGYEAGEYKVTIRDSRSGAKIGTPTRLKFEGENEIIDRRSIVFSGEKKKKKKEPEAEESSTSESTASDSDSPSESDDEGMADDEGMTEDEGMADEGADGPPPIEEKPGGCGCRTAGSPANDLSWLSVALLLGVGLLRRRR